MTYSSVEQEGTCRHSKYYLSKTQLNKYRCRTVNVNDPEELKYIPILFINSDHQKRLLYVG